MDWCGEAGCGCTVLCLALAIKNMQFVEEKEPNSRWSNEIFTSLFSDTACALLFCTCSVSFSSGCSDQLSNICLPEKKKKRGCLSVWKINWVISVTGKLPALVKMGGEGTQILTAID